jgi:tRNA pseudouridine38-40 synthase
LRYFIRLSYNGKNYNGWQIQGNAPSVQKTLNEALSVILKQDIHTTGCGRTDTGVHAEEFYAHFDVINESILLNTQYSILNTIYKLNGILPIDIAVHDILPVKDDAHARFNAVSRTYKYIIIRHKDPFHNDFAWFQYGKLNLAQMNKAAEMLKNYSDFTSFAKLHSNTKTNICKITHAEWTEIDSPLELSEAFSRAPLKQKFCEYWGLRGVFSDSNKNYQLSTINYKLIFTITADRFLRNMVRAIVGTLLDVGKEKINLKEFQEIIESKNRSDAGSSVPAHALFLTQITYPPDIFK